LALVAHGVDGLADLGGRGGLELLEPDVADVVIEPLGEHARHLDPLALELELLHALPLALALDADGDLGARLAAEPRHRVIEGHVEGGLVVDLDDAIVALAARAR